MNKKIFFRSIEAASLSAYLYFTVRLIINVYRATGTASLSLTSSATVLAVAFIGYVLADFVSGVVHFAADNFGSPQTPFFGPKFIRPFREHHEDPKAMTRHSFLEVNGDNALVSLLVLVPVYYLVPPDASRINFLICIGVVVFICAIVLTNQIHSWAHADNAPRIVRYFQKYRIILSPAHHSVHHTSPFDTYYCITTGWLNKIIEKTAILPRIVFWVKKQSTK